MELNLSNKKVLVTGSSRGIGLKIAQSYLSENSWVCINGRNQNHLAKIIKETKSKKLFSLKYDLSNEKNHALILSDANKIMNGLDILVCNLGDGRANKKIGDENYKDWVKSINVNLLSTTNLINLSRKYLKKSKTPSIVCISSVCGMISSSAPLDYSVSKSALYAYVKNQSRILGEYNIRINIVTPGNIFSKDGRWVKKFRENKKLKNQLTKNVPLKRFGSTNEIAIAVLFLSSELSSFTTGANLVVDGGQST